MLAPVPPPSVAVTDVPPDAYLLDVREPEEWQAGHVAGAHLVPLQSLPTHLGDLPADRTIHVVCRSGHRSAYAATWLGAQGFDAVNVDGGLLAWTAAGRPLEGEAGDPPYVR